MRARGQNWPLDSSKSENRKPMSVKSMLMYMKLDRVPKTDDKKESNNCPDSGLRTPSTPMRGARCEIKVNSNSSSKSKRERVPMDLTPGVSITSIKEANSNQSSLVQQNLTQVTEWKILEIPEEVEPGRILIENQQVNESLSR